MLLRIHRLCSELAWSWFPFSPHPSHSSFDCGLIPRNAHARPCSHLCLRHRCEQDDVGSHVFHERGSLRPGLQPGNVFHILMSFRAQRGISFWGTDFNLENKIPHSLRSARNHIQFHPVRIEEPRLRQRNSSGRLNILTQAWVLLCLSARDGAVWGWRSTPCSRVSRRCRSVRSRVRGILAHRQRKRVVTRNGVA